MPTEKKDFVQGDFHAGHTLMAIAGTYGTLMQVPSECVQNAIDAGAQKIRIIIDRKKRDIIIRDNGDGMSPADFETFIQNICFSQKSAGKYGKWGRGMVAAYGKCEWFMITSLPKGEHRGYTEWTFNTKKMLGERRFLVPTRPREDLCIEVPRPRHGETLVDWQTEVLVHNYTRDPLIGKISLEELDTRISGNYAKALAERRIDLVITLIEEDGRERSRRIRGSNFSGLPLPEVTLSDPDAGETVFRLFETRKRKGGLIFVIEADDPFRLPVASFARHAAGHLTAEAVKVLNSGALEGLITSEKGKLDPNREQFQNNAALVGLCRQINQWSKDTGAPILAELQEEGKDERQRKSWLEVLGDFSGMAKTPNCRHFADVLNRSKYGTIGENHADIPLSRITGKQDAPSTAASGGAGKPRASSGTTNPAPSPSSGIPPTNKTANGTAPKADPDHMPLIVGGLNGRRRRLEVRNDSLGLEIRHEAPEDSTKLFQFISERGLLLVNARHTNFVKCEPYDEALKGLQRKIILNALTSASMPAHLREMVEHCQEREMPGYVYFLVQDALARGKPQPKKSRAQRPPASRTA